MLDVITGDCKVVQITTDRKFVEWLLGFQNNHFCSNLFYMKENPLFFPLFHKQYKHISMDECNAILSACSMYSPLDW